MNHHDAINGLFEVLGGLFISASCLRLYRDKKIHGVSLWHPGFFWTWGIWNLIFYPAVGATLSTIGGVGVVLSNTVWCAMIIYYRK